MRSKIRLALVLSLLVHGLLLLGLFSGVGRPRKEGGDFVVDLVSMPTAESPPFLFAGDSTGASDLIPPRPAFPMQSEEVPASAEEALPSPPALASAEEEEQVSPPVDQETPESALPEGPGAPFDAGLPPAEGVDAIERTFHAEEKAEPAIRFVAEGARSGNVSAGGGGEGEKGSGSSGGEPTVGDAFPGGIGGAGGGQIGPRFVIPKAGRSNPKPRYPERARAEGREGTALLRVTVLPTGKVGEALIEQSSGHTDLDRSAVEAVMKWTFLPARRGENPVVSSVRIPVTFALDRP